MRRHARAHRLEAAVGAEGVAFAGEHAGRVFIFAFKGEHARSKWEIAGQMLLAQKTQQFALVIKTRQIDLADGGTGQ